MSTSPLLRFHDNLLYALRTHGYGNDSFYLFNILWGLLGWCRLGVLYMGGVGQAQRTKGWQWMLERRVTLICPRVGNCKNSSFDYILMTN